MGHRDGDAYDGLDEEERGQLQLKDMANKVLSILFVSRFVISLLRNLMSLHLYRFCGNVKQLSRV